MKKIKISLSGKKSHPIFIENSFSGFGKAVKRLSLAPSCLVVSPRPVSHLYGKKVINALRLSGFKPLFSSIKDGESEKTLQTVHSLYKVGLKARLDRKSFVVALGGGVTGDMAGFFAATYMRGIPIVQCPTSLLAMVDSSIGGKTGVDLPEGKNLVGAFWQPKLVWMNLSVLETLPVREWQTGMAEIIKYGFIADPKIISLLEKIDLLSLKSQPSLIENLVSRSASIKARVISRDEFETKGLRSMLNYGHTFGHAIEAVSGYRVYTHGEAISVGMCAAVRLGVKMKTFKKTDVSRVENLFRRWGLPVRVKKKLSRTKILSAMSRDKKVMNGSFRFVIPMGWGKVKIVQGISPSLIQSVLAEVGI